MLEVVPWRRRAVIVACLPLAALWMACGGPAPTEESAENPTPGPSAESAPVAAEGLAVQNAMLQWVPGMEMASVYFDVVNPGAADKLLRVESSLVGRAETHETLADGDTLRMEARPEGFEVPAAGTLRLEPGGKHIMLIDPTAPAEGEEFPLTLHFASGATLEVTLPVGTEHAGMDHSEMDHSEMDHSTMDHSGMDHSTMDHGSGHSETDEDAAGSDGSSGAGGGV